MDQSDALGLIRAAVTREGGVWADLGAGAGTFTRALASLLGPEGAVYAVDRDTRALRSLATSRGDAAIHTVEGDFTAPLALPPLDGAVLANALHYVPYADQPNVLRTIAAQLVPGAPLVVVEYERRNANRWVPYPTPVGTLAAAAESAGLSAPLPLASHPSRFGGAMYAAVLTTDRGRRT